MGSKRNSGRRQGADQRLFSGLASACSGWVGQSRDKGIISSGSLPVDGDRSPPQATPNRQLIADPMSCSLERTLSCKRPKLVFADT